MALYIPHSIFHLARLLYVRPETFGPYYVIGSGANINLIVTPQANTPQRSVKSALLFTFVKYEHCTTTVAMNTAFFFKS